MTGPSDRKRWPSILARKHGEECIERFRERHSNDPAHAEHAERLLDRLETALNINVIGASDELTDRIELGKLSRSPDWFNDFALMLAARAKTIRDRQNRAASARKLTSAEAAQSRLVNVRVAVEKLLAERNATGRLITTDAFAIENGVKARDLERYVSKTRKQTANERRRGVHYLTLSADARARLYRDPTPPAPAPDEMTADEEFDALVELTRHLDE